jgi:hypothetical protein
MARYVRCALNGLQELVDHFLKKKYGAETVLNELETLEAVALAAGLNRKTIERALDGELIERRSRLKLATALGVSEQELDPDGAGRGERECGDFSGRHYPTVIVHHGPDQEAWVGARLAPRLRWGEAVVRAGAAGAQAAEEQPVCHVAVLSPADLASVRAQLATLEAEAGDTTVVAVLRGRCPEPPPGRHHWKCVDLSDDRGSAPWAEVFEACEVDFGVPAPEWLQQREAMWAHLARNESVNLIVEGNVSWRGLLDIRGDEGRGRLGVIDLHQPQVASRAGLVAQLLAQACGERATDVKEPDDLVLLGCKLENLTEPARVALVHADMFRCHSYRDDVVLFAALRNLIVEKRLVLLIHSRESFARLLPNRHPLSAIALKRIRLTGRG